jgi:rod shape-determining protein MreC
MQRLFNILVTFKEYVVVTLLIIISLILLIGNDTPQVRAIRSYTVGFVGVIQDVLSLIPNIVELKQENEVLRRMNVNLSDEVSRLREARLENLRLREMLAMKDRGEFKLLPAEVIGKSLHLLRNTLTMSAGEIDGVKIDMPIISEQGLVGKVIAVSSRYSIGQLVINKDFRSSAKVQRSRVDGIVTWDGGDVLHLKNVAKKQDVLSGDLITTSDYSNVFPRNIKIGTIASVSEPPGSLFKEIDVVPSVDFPSLEEVFIIMAVADTERTALEHRTLHIKQ